MNRYRREAERHYKVLDKHLAGRQYIVGDDLTIVDMSAWGWLTRAARVLPGEGDPLAAFPDLARWFKSIDARPAAARARAVGKEFAFKREVDEETRRAMFPVQLSASGRLSSGEAGPGSPHTFDPLGGAPSKAKTASHFQKPFLPRNEGRVHASECPAFVGLALGRRDGPASAFRLADVLLGVELQAELIHQRQLRLEEIDVMFLVRGQLLEQVHGDPVIDQSQWRAASR